MDESLIRKCRDARGRVDYGSARAMIYNRFEEINADVRASFLMRALVDFKYEAYQKGRSLFGIAEGFDESSTRRDFVIFAREVVFEAWIYYGVKLSNEQSAYMEKQLAFWVDDKNIGKPRLIVYLTKEQLAEPRRLKGVEERNLPPELDTEAARKYFPRAIQADFMEAAGDGCKWKFGGNRGQARLGYFLSKVYEQPRPLSAIETYFAVKDISASISAAENAYKDKPMRADVKRWRDEIDKAVFND